MEALNDALEYVNERMAQKVAKKSQQPATNQNTPQIPVPKKTAPPPKKQPSSTPKEVSP